ncbi:cytochrome c-type biogenesis protein [Polynucleobacter sp. HIN5]|uniref:cytochrome c-type biogenesis protein n=1 Tax=Polynucleobacter sp. HIN5 TaxID=3047864 RepID=UPI0025722BCE|nr:cytochrome c-type biogenesis protein [Polynucleobacter sp. HIN5]BEI33046.1 cytochrome c-type biogenesis protein CcmH [Polynucleobacter sp. HIN5]
MKRFSIILTGLLFSFAISSIGFTQSNAAPSVSENPALEKKVLEVSNELRCLVCQNQTIADSNADLAVDLKNQVRQQLSEGRSKQEILKYMTERYGDFVLYNPPLNAATLMLWVGPFLLMLLGLILLVRQIKQRKQELSKETFSAEEIERARQLLDRKLGNQ